MSLDSFFSLSDDQHRSYRDYLREFKEQKKALAVCRRRIVLLTGAFAPLAAVFGKRRDSLRDVVEQEIAIGDEINAMVNGMTDQYGRDLEPLSHYLERLVTRIETCRATKIAEIAIKEHRDPLEYLRSLQQRLNKIIQDAARERLAIRESDAFLYGGEANFLAETSRQAYETFKTVNTRIADKQEHVRATYRIYLGNIELGRASDYIRKSIHDLRLSSDAIYTEVERGYHAITHLFTTNRVPLFPKRTMGFFPRPDEDDEDALGVGVKPK